MTALEICLRDIARFLTSLSSLLPWMPLKDILVKKCNNFIDFNTDRPQCPIG